VIINKTATSVQNKIPYKSIVWIFKIFFEK